MFERGARVYAANGCIYCHSQQVRAYYAADDIERKWGNRRSAPRDYIFEQPVFLGKMRIGQDIANIGARAPAERASPPPPSAAAPTASPGIASSPAASPAPQGAAPAAGSPVAKQTPSPSPAAQVGSPAPAASPAAPGGSPAASPGSPAPKARAAPGAPVSSASPSAIANVSPGASPTPAAGAPWPVQTIGEPPMYSAAWHHVHLYSPRSINVDSNMPSYRFLYKKRRISDARSADALQLTGSDAPPEGWEVVPSFDAKCLVAYLMSLNQSHPLNEVKSVGGAPAAPAPAAGSPAPASPAPPK
jgi:hypothetical protein